MNSEAADNDLDHLTLDEVKALTSLRNRGWAVCLFGPWELGQAKPHRVEEAMAQAANRYIDQVFK